MELQSIIPTGQRINKRCPLFLLEIQQIDPKWKSDDDDSCLELFHKILTYTFVREFKAKYTTEKFDEFCSAFNVLDESGFDIEEIMTADLTMIKRA